MCVAGCHNTQFSLQIGRQFKEASLFASQVKTMSVEVEAEQQTLTQAEQAMAEANSTLAQLSQQLNTTQQQASRLERQEGIHTCYTITYCPQR